MKNFLKKIWSKFLTVFGDIKVFRFPLFIVYDPNYFKMTGDRILEVSRKIKPGDVILRGYDGYLDGKFVPSNKGYSHAGVYVGDDMVIHAVAPNVQKTSIVDFCECDRIAIIRPESGIEMAIARAEKFLEDSIPYDFLFEHGSSSLYCFELAQECYRELDIRPIQKSKFFGLIKKTVVLSDSFFNSTDMQTVFEYNPKYGIDINIL